MKRIICIFLSFMLVFVLSACFENEKNAFDAEAFCTEFFSEEGLYTDELGNTYNYSYKIPEFNLESEDAKELNDKIKKDFYKLCENEKTSMADGLSLVVVSVSYETYIKGEILSFLVKALYDSDYTSYGAYSINVATGKAEKVQDFLLLSGLEKEEFIGEIKKAAGDKYKEIYGDPEGKEYLMYAYDYTVSDDAVNMDMPMFIGENGNLFAVAKIGSVAGAAYYEYIIDTGIRVIK